MSQTEVQIRREVRSILSRILPAFYPELSDEDDILATGMDSVSTLLLITELENKYSITLAAGEIPYQQFHTISGIAAFVATRLEYPEPLGAGA